MYPGVRIDALDSTTVVFSFGSLPAVKFEQLLPQEFDWLMSHAGPSLRQNGIAPEQVSAELPRFAHLEQELQQAGFARASRPPQPDISMESASSEISDIQARGLDGLNTLRRRRQAAVAVRGISRSSLAVIRILAASGVENFIIDDDRAAATSDLYADPYYPRNYSDRRSAVVAMLGTNFPRANVLSSQVSPTVALVCSDDEYDYNASALLSAFSVPHLNVLVNHLHVGIGPFVIPTISPHLCCYGVPQLSSPRPSDSSRATTWEDLAEGGTVLSEASEGAGIHVAAARAVMAAGMSAQEILNFIDGFVPSTARSVLECGRFNPAPRLHVLEADESCVCSAETLVAGAGMAGAGIAETDFSNN